MAFDCDFIRPTSASPYSQFAIIVERLPSSILPRLIPALRGERRDASPTSEDTPYCQFGWRMKYWRHAAQ